MNRQQIQAPTVLLIQASLACADHLSKARLDIGPYVPFYVADFEADAQSGALSDAGKWRHILAVNASLKTVPAGSIDGATFKALTVDLGKGDRRIFKSLWVKIDGRRWNRGTLKTFLAGLHRKLSRGLRAKGRIPDPLRLAIVQGIETLTSPEKLSLVANDLRKSLVTREIDEVTKPVKAQVTSPKSKLLDEKSKSQPPPRARASSSGSGSFRKTGKTGGGGKDALRTHPPPSFSDKDSQDSHETRQSTDAEDSGSWQEANPHEAVHQTLVELRPIWYAKAQRECPARAPTITNAARRRIDAQLANGRTVWDLLASLRGVQHNAFHLGKRAGAKRTRMRVGYADLFYLDDERDAVEINLGLAADEPVLNEMAGDGV